MVGWTETGRKIQSLSNLCPSPVQCLSRKRSCRGFVKALSQDGPSPVKHTSRSTSLGQGLDRQIQSLSRACPLKLKNAQFFSLDKLWTDIGIGNRSSGFTFGVFEMRKCQFGQRLDKPMTWTDSGQSLNWSHLLAYGLSTNIVQMDRYWTKL